MAQDRLGSSERRASHLAGQHRPVERAEPCGTEDDAPMRAPPRHYQLTRL
jgi:hypothetical protein